MNDVVHACHRPGGDARLRQVGLQKLDDAEAIDVLPAPRRQIVDDADGMATHNQRLRDVRSDEAGASRHQVARHGPRDS